MLTEDKVQADNMLDRMLVQAFLWYPEFDKEADICGGMVGVVVMFNVNHQESNTITPEKCIVPVHLLTRGFNADWTRQRAGPGQAPLSSGGRTV